MFQVIGLLQKKALNNSINHFIYYYKELNSGRRKFKVLFRLSFLLDTMDHLHDN
jgi:hypothetical protein